jgi:hypothetical protein
MIDYDKINKDEKFNSLDKPDVFDNAQGNADFGMGQVVSKTPNKTSVYLFYCFDKCVARMVNISTTNIDGVDDNRLCGYVLMQMVNEYLVNKHLFKKNYISIWMNSLAYNQLMAWWWDKKECKEPKGIGSFAGTDICIDDDIKNNQETVT